MSVGQEPNLTALVSKIHINTGDSIVAGQWLVRQMMLGVEYPGFLSADISPPSSPDQPDWTLVQCFSSHDDMKNWRACEVRSNLMKELQPLIDNNSFTLTESLEDRDFGKSGSVNVAIVTHVKPGMESNYFECEGKLQLAQAKFPGYRGAFVQPPTPSTVDRWTTLVRFDSPKSLDNWFASEVRKKLLSETEAYVDSTDFQKVATSFPGWFPVGDQSQAGPPNWKSYLLVLLGLFPCVTFEIKYLNPLLAHLNVALGNFIGNCLSVAFTTWISMPLFIILFNKWLFPTKDTPKWMNAGCTAFIFVLFVIEIALLWGLFT